MEDSSIYSDSFDTTLTTSNDVNSGLLIAILVPLVITIIVSIALLLVSNWKIYQKAGRQGWEGIVPVYNIWILFTEIVKRPKWWGIVALLTMVPFVNYIVFPVYFVLSIIASVDLSKNFGKGSGFAALLIFLPIIALPMLAFGNSAYTPINRSGTPN